MLESQALFTNQTGEAQAWAVLSRLPWSAPSGQRPPGTRGEDHVVPRFHETEEGVFPVVGTDWGSMEWLRGRKERRDLGRVDGGRALLWVGCCQEAGHFHDFVPQSSLVIGRAKAVACISWGRATVHVRCCRVWTMFMFCLHSGTNVELFCFCLDPLGS